MNVKLSSSERRRHQQAKPPWSTLRNPHQRPIPGGLGWDGPWLEPIPEDAVCTPLPDDDHRPIRLGGSYKPQLDSHGRPYEWGTPYTVVEDGDPAYRSVYEYKEPDDGGLLGLLSQVLAGLFGLGRTKHRIPIVGSSRLPWVGGWPSDPPGYGDCHYLVVDLGSRRLWECINTRPSLLPSPSWWFSRVTEWDLDRPYREQADKHRGVVAARMPKLPHTVRFDEIVAGHVDHAIGVALPRYKPGNPVYPAMGTDGRHVVDQHGVEVREVPVHAGQRLRLRADVLEGLRSTLPQGSARLTVATALHEYGLVCGDTTARNHGSAWVAPDGRWEFTDLPGFDLPLSMFEAVEPFHTV